MQKENSGMDENAEMTFQIVVWRFGFNWSASEITWIR